MTRRSPNTRSSIAADLERLDKYFPRISEAFVATRRASVGLVGEAPSTLASSRAVVDFAVDYLARALEKAPIAKG